MNNLTEENGKCRSCGDHDVDFESGDEVCNSCWIDVYHCDQH